MKEAIQNLLQLGAVAECTPVEDQFISKIFLAPKPNGQKRFILNLKPLNKFISKHHFKMEDHRTAAKLIQKNGFMATIDLKEAYLLIPINVADRKYLRFQFGAESDKLITYEFTAMPYGLSVAPRIFTKIMREVITKLRSSGHKSVVYLDDILFIGDSYHECIDNVHETLKLLQYLGFVINFQKSSLNPQQECKFLGFNFDSRSLSFSLPVDKRNNIIQLVKRFLQLPRCSIRGFAQLIGTLVSACSAVKYGLLYTISLERQKYLALLKNDDYEAKFKPSPIILEDLQWWLRIIPIAQCPMRHPSYKFEIYTDASGTGWGAVCGDKRAHGTWKDSERDFHINYLELLAVFLGLKCFVKNQNNCSVLLRVDNTTAISYVNRMGGIQYPHLNNLARSIWQWCETRNIWIFASYVNTKDNYADSESRLINPDTEWELSDEAFQTLVQHYGQPNIDLFASRTNAKCDHYVSWKPDPDAVAVDAFTLNWSLTYFYMFPPFSLILKCLRKVIDDKADGIIVFPNWPSQPWFPLLQKLISSEVLYFQPSKWLVQSSSRERHRLHTRLTLGVARLRQSLIRRGCPTDAQSLMLASLSNNTLKQYSVTYKLWWQYCNNNNIDVFEPPKSSVLSFLAQTFQSGCSYGTLNSHRSALSLILRGKIGSDEDVKRLLKGAYRLKPNRPKYTHTWDPQLVLNCVSTWYPNDQLSLEKLTKKLVGLLAICTAHRVQTFSLIKLENVTISEVCVQIGITDVIKTSESGREQPVLKLPYFKDNIAICPATVLKDYISATQPIRTGNIDRLLLTYKKPHKPASSQTISRWIKQVLLESGVDVTIFTAHSTLHASTSAAHAAGISIDTIRKTAGWTESSSTFTRFYHRNLVNEENFASSICLPNQ